VDADFLAPTEFKLRFSRRGELDGFRVQLADRCSAAFALQKRSR
jgi:hypothetical protein